MMVAVQEEFILSLARHRYECELYEAS